MPASGEHHPAFEEYCECIFELREDDLDVIQARIAERLQVSRPAVSEMMKRLEAEGLITSDDGIRLTDEGRRLGERVLRGHRLAEVFLTDVLKLSWAEAHHEAGKWEHIMSDSVERALNDLLGSPTTCPHGNPIPGSGYVVPATTPLAQLSVGTSFNVQRIPEELEFTEGMLEFLEASHITPGVSGTVIAMSPDGTTTVESAAQRNVSSSGAATPAGTVADASSVPSPSGVVANLRTNLAQASIEICEKAVDRGW